MTLVLTHVCIVHVGCLGSVESFYQKNSQRTEIQDVCSLPLQNSMANVVTLDPSYLTIKLVSSGVAMGQP